MTDSKESLHYAKLGASSSKQGVLQALGKDSCSQYFVELSDDVCGDPDYFSVIHADGVGTKSIVAYLAYRESGDPSWFRTLAQDSVVMNLDDVACVGAFEGLLLSNTIGRNRSLIGDDIVKELIEGYRECSENLRAQGIDIQLGGGETADLGDLVRTVVIDSTLFGRVKRKNVVNTINIAAGDVIVGLSNTGRASYEQSDNSSISSNGLTLARHALIASNYGEKYPEILNPSIDQQAAYRGQGNLLEKRPELNNCSVAEALLSPTRSYAPIVKTVLEKCDHSKVHAIVNCTGGGQTKLLRFGQGCHYVKDNLFDCPPLFASIQNNCSIPWAEMYSVFNMGHRMELVCEPAVAAEIIDISKSFGVAGKQIGFVESSNKGSNSLTIATAYGTCNY